MGKRRGNGEGSVFKRADGRWEGTMSVGRGRRKSFYGTTRQEAWRKLSAALKALQEGLPILGERQTISQFMSVWLASVTSSLKPRSVQRYEELIRLHIVPEIGGIRLARLQPQDLQRLYASRLEAGRSAATVVQVHAVLHKALDGAVRMGLTTRNVADSVTRPRVSRREMMALSPEQARILLGVASGDPLEALYVVAITGGLRQGELLALKWRNVHFESGQLEVLATLQMTKTGPELRETKTAQSRRSVTLSRTALESLKRHRAAQAERRLMMGALWEDGDLVFTDDTGGPMNPDRVRREFRRLVRDAGLPVMRFHDLRHSAATLMLGQGIHPKIVSEMLGHATVAITLDLYSHVTPTMQRQAADSLDAVLAQR